MCKRHLKTQHVLWAVAAMLIVILATDPLFQSAALVDTQVYRARNAQVLLIVPEGNQALPAVRQVGAQAVIPVPAVPRPFVPIINAVLGDIIARTLASLSAEQQPGLPRLSS